MRWERVAAKCLEDVREFLVGWKTCEPILGPDDLPTAEEVAEGLDDCGAHYTVARVRAALAALESERR